MPRLKTYNLFISHAWKYSDEYLKLIRFLDQAKYFHYNNYSVPKHDPLFDPRNPVGQRKLTNALTKQIEPVNCVLIVSGMYVAYRDWLKSEIALAKKYNKPIIGIKPWGQKKIPLEVQLSAIEMVGWNTSSIVNAIRKHAL